MSESKSPSLKKAASSKGGSSKSKGISSNSSTKETIIVVVKEKDSQDEKKKKEPEEESDLAAECRHCTSTCAKCTKSCLARMTYLNMIFMLQILGTLSLIFIIVMDVLLFINLLTIKTSLGQISSMLSLFYYIFLCIILVMSIWERPIIDKWVKILYSWIGLGMGHIAIGILTMSQTCFVIGKNTLQISMNVACYIIVTVGCFFIILGFICRGDRNNKMKEFRKKEEKKAQQEEETKENKAVVEKKSAKKSIRK